MRIDFFVHPLYGGENHPSQEIHQQYLDGLADVLKQSSLPILIATEQDHDFRALLPRENQFTSAVLKMGDEWSSPMGELYQGDLKRLERRLGGNASLCDMRIHGANFGQCTQGFAMQLFFTFFRGRAWYPQEEEPFVVPSNRARQTLYDAEERRGSFAKGKISYGVVLEKETPEIVEPWTGIASWFTPLSPKRGYGNKTYQLMSKETVVYTRNGRHYGKEGPRSAELVPRLHPVSVP